MLRKLTLGIAAGATLAAGLAFAPSEASARTYYYYYPYYGWYAPAYYGWGTPYWGYGWRPVIVRRWR